MNKLKFSLGKNNTKLSKLEQVTGKKVYSLSTLAGTTCVGAKDCWAAAVKKKGGGYILKHGKDQKYTCFAASLSVAFPNVRKQWEYNTILLKKCKTVKNFVDLIERSLPTDAEIIRWGVSGDVLSQNHFDALIKVAENNPSIIFYQYTKSLLFWVKRLNKIPNNYCLTASRGGRFDYLIDKYNLRTATVVFSEEEAEQLGLEIDEDDSHAALPTLKSVSFALLIHGKQQAGSKSAEALRILNRKKKNASISVKND